MNITTKIGQIEVEKVQGRFIVRMENGTAITMGATKKAYEELLKEIESGKWDEYYNKFGRK